MQFIRGSIFSYFQVIFEILYGIGLQLSEPNERALSFALKNLIEKDLPPYGRSLKDSHRMYLEMLK